MGGPGTSSDILGIEIARDAMRGVLLDQATAELTTVGECAMPAHAVNPDGVIDPMVVGPVLENLLTQLDVYDRSKLRIGLSIGPKNSGVGSGSTMMGWLDSLVKNINEPLRCSGGLGIAFTPSRAVDAVVKLASDAGIELARIDFAPVAAARAIGEQIDDAICVGSGQGWQARMRDFEVLEAMENASIGFNVPLHLALAGGQSQSISRYGWVEISPAVNQLTPLDVGQFAVAVGTAIGVAHGSPADLLSGKTIGCLADRSPVDQSLQHLAEVDLREGSESTLQLQPKQSPGGPGGPGRSGRSDAQRTTRQTPTTSLSPLRRSVAGPEPEAELAPASSPARDREPAGATVAPKPRRASKQIEMPVESYDQQAAEWEDGLHEADPITMFSPDTEVEEMMGKRNRRLSVDIFIGLLVISLIALGAAYFLL